MVKQDTLDSTRVQKARAYPGRDSAREQLRMAGFVQRDFLPDKLPNTDRLRWAVTFMPAEWVAGDIYDVTRLDENHIGFYIVDVVGHGVPAALLTMFIKQALVMRETIRNKYRIFSPSDVLGNLNNRMLQQKLSGHQFATCCYCLLDTRTLELTYARAGHPLPVVIKSGCELVQLDTAGPLLGVFEDAQFAESSIRLETGDKFLLYSDGVEPLIGGVEKDSSFRFSPDFCKSADGSIATMNERFRWLTLYQETTPPQVDDATTVGLEIL